VSEIMAAAINLHRLGLNPDLAEALQVKAACIERQAGEDSVRSPSVRSVQFGLVVIFLDPHPEHRNRSATSGTGRSAGIALQFTTAS
jgi:hypothetical protein